MENTEKYMDGASFINKILANLTDLPAENLIKVKFAVAAALQDIKLRVMSTELRTDRDDNMESIQAFIANKQSKNCTKGTIYQYCLSIRRMFTFCDRNFRDITSVDIINFINHLRMGAGLSETSVRNNLRNLSSYFAFLKTYGYITINPVELVELPAVHEKERQPIPKEEMIRLKDNAGLRNEAILDLLRSSGIRISELVALNIEDLDFFGDRVLIRRGKGGDSRMAVMSTEARVHILEYLHSRTDKSKALFVTCRKPHNRLTAAGIRSMLKELARTAGVESNIFPHRFRHTMITEVAEHGLPDSSIQKLSGHKDVNTTMRYTHKSIDNIQMQHKLCFG